MSAGSRAVKATAITTLKGNFLNSCLASLAVIVCVFVCYITASLLSMPIGEIAATVIYAVICILLISPVALGLIRYFWRMLFGAFDSPIAVFYYLSEKRLYVKAMKLVLSLTLKLLLYGAIIFVPVALLWLFSQGFIYEALGMHIPLWSTYLESVLSYLYYFGAVILTAVMLRYYIAPVLFVADENMDSSEAIHMAAVISRKTYLDFVFIIFSFILWILLSVFIIPLVFTLPYMLTAYVIHVRFAVAEYNMFVEKNNSGDFYNEL